MAAIICSSVITSVLPTVSKIDFATWIASIIFLISRKAGHRFTNRNGSVRHCPHDRDVLADLPRDLADADSRNHGYDEVPVGTQPGADLPQQSVDLLGLDGNDHGVGVPNRREIVLLYDEAVLFEFLQKVASFFASV